MVRSFIRAPERVLSRATVACRPMRPFKLPGPSIPWPTNRAPSYTDAVAATVNGCPEVPELRGEAALEFVPSFIGAVVLAVVLAVAVVVVLVVVVVVKMGLTLAKADAAAASAARSRLMRNSSSAWSMAAMAS